MHVKTKSPRSGRGDPPADPEKEEGEAWRMTKPLLFHGEDSRAGGGRLRVSRENASSSRFGGL